MHTSRSNDPNNVITGSSQLDLDVPSQKATRACHHNPHTCAQAPPQAEWSLRRNILHQNSKLSSDQMSKRLLA
jgi:hypothetical protein